MFSAIALASVLAAVAHGQQIGTNTAEVHPLLTTEKCVKGGTCTNQATSVVLDANWRWVHSVGGYTNCYTGNTWNPTLCPDPTTCAANCALDGAAYGSTYGISTSGNALTLDFVTGTNVGSRTYLMNSPTTYEEFMLLNQEFTFDVDVSQLPCGLNGALYFSQMAADGGMAANPGNKAGAAYGTGYCDSQCPQDIKFINGKANIAGWTPSSNNANTGTGNTGACCFEMDIWEANSIAAAYTPHDCAQQGLYACTGAACGNNPSSGRYSAPCDKDGCDFNSYRMGNTTFYGPGMTVDTTKPFTVVTQFITNDGTSTGTLVEIRRIYVQNGNIIPNSQSDVPGVTGNSITDAFCNEAKTAFNNTNEFETMGGLAAMGKAMSTGMVLVMSLWDDYSVDMLWLDSTYPTNAAPGTPGAFRGTCSTTSGVPSQVEAASPNAKVVYSNIKVGDLGSTYGNGNNVVPPWSGGSPPPSSSVSPPPSSTSVAPPPPSSTTTPPPVSSTPAGTCVAVTVTNVMTMTSTVTVTVGGTTSPPKTSTTTTPPPPPPTSSPSGGTAPKWGQCGGQGWTGPTVCAAGSTCTYSNPYYSQCL